MMKQQRQKAIRGINGLGIGKSHVWVLLWMLLLSWSTAYAQGGRQLYSQVTRDANPELALHLNVDGQKTESVAGQIIEVPHEADVELLVELTYTGDEELVSRVEAKSPKLTNAAIAEGAPATLGLAQANLKADGSRTVVAWLIPIATDGSGLSEAGAVSASLSFKGFEDRAAYSVESLGIKWEKQSKPFPWGLVLQWLIGIIIVGVVGFFGGRFVLDKVQEFQAQREESPEFTSDDPSPFEQAHAELASCDMKAQTGDIEGFVAKFRPILYNFAAATEGPGVLTLNAEELARHFESVGYNPRVGALLVDCLKICERYEATGQEPRQTICVQMVQELREAAVACTKKSPRGIKNS
jgi:hypothetical protein